jgi:hypothetical protein
MEWRLAGVFSAAPIVRDLQHQPMLKIGQHRILSPDLWAIGPLSQSLAKACSWSAREARIDPQPLRPLEFIGQAVRQELFTTTITLIAGRGA